MQLLSESREPADLAVAGTGATIGSIVSLDIRTAKIFRKYGIDFCCGGHRTIEEVCASKRIERTELELQLLNPGNVRHAGVMSADQWELDFLATYITNIHHAYVWQTIPLMLSLAEKVVEFHRAQYPETEKVAKLLVKLCREMEAHLETEEKVLFPYICEMAQVSRSANPGHAIALSSVGSPLRVLVNQHEMVGNDFMEIETLTGNFTPPEDACNTLKVFYATLKEFEDDLFLHIHLENNILFPKAERMERELRTR